MLGLGSGAVPSSIFENVKGCQNVEPTREQGSSKTSRDAVRITVTIAVIGMSCKFPGANLADERWQLLMKGTSMA